jgi:hypothetical protein
MRAYWRSDAKRSSCVTIGYRPDFSRRRSPFRKARNAFAVIACMAVGVMTVATAVGALARQNDPAARAALAGQTLRSVATDKSGVDARTRIDCNDFASAFLNEAACSKMRAKRVTRTVPRLATFTLGRNPQSP